MEIDGELETNMASQKYKGFCVYKKIFINDNISFSLFRFDSILRVFFVWLRLKLFLHVLLYFSLTVKQASLAYVNHPLNSPPAD